MNEPAADKVFSGSIPKLYDTHLVPLIFEPYAADLASRVASRYAPRVLEIAAGTGVVPRKPASTLPVSVSPAATALNQTMLALPAEDRPGRPARGVAARAGGGAASRAGG